MSDWRYLWATYEGPVCVIGNSTEVLYGIAVGEKHVESGNPLMRVKLDSSDGFKWFHPKYVQPMNMYH